MIFCPPACQHAAAPHPHSRGGGLSGPHAAAPHPQRRGGLSDDGRSVGGLSGPHGVAAAPHPPHGLGPQGFRGLGHLKKKIKQCRVNCETDALFFYLIGITW